MEKSTSGYLTADLARAPKTFVVLDGALKSLYIKLGEDRLKTLGDMRS